MVREGGGQHRQTGPGRSEGGGAQPAGAFLLSAWPVDTREEVVSGRLSRQQAGVKWRPRAQACEADWHLLCQLCGRSGGSVWQRLQGGGATRPTCPHCWLPSRAHDTGSGGPGPQRSGEIWGVREALYPQSPLPSRKCCFAVFWESERIVQGFSRGLVVKTFAFQLSRGTGSILVGS